MHERTCTICGEIAKPRNYKRGMCGACYQRWQYHGHVTSRPLKGMDLFWTRVEKTETCWNWAGTLDAGGYGRYGAGFLFGEKQAHRIAYVDARGPIPERLVLDHLCRNRRCVNPRHLEVVTNRVNILRGESPPAVNAEKIRCVNGHEFDRPRKSNRRACSKCQAKWDAEWYSRNRGDRPTRVRYDGQPCNKVGCERPAKARGLCHTCYVRERRREKRAA